MTADDRRPTLTAPALGLATTLLATFLLPPPTAAALSPGGEDWPRFRGASGVGTAEATGLPVELGPETNVVWKAPAPFGRSSPAVANGTVYLTGADDDHYHVLAYREADGEQLWKRSIERTERLETFPSNDPASPSPVADDDSVFAYFPELGLVAFDSEGTERWRAPMGPFRNYYGMGSSPVLAAGAVVLQLDHDDTSSLVAFDQTTGERRWQVERDREKSWATPIVLPSPSGEVILTAGALWLDAYSAETGDVLWSWLGIGNDTLASPTYEDGVVYILSGGGFPFPPYDGLLRHDEDGDGRLSVAESAADALWGQYMPGFDTDGDGQISRQEWDHHLEENQAAVWGLQAIELPDPSKEPGGRLWHQKVGGSNVPTPLALGDLVYVIRDGGILAAHDRSTGELVRRDRLGALGSYFASPVAADGKIFFGAGGGELVVVRPGREWEVLAVNDLGSPVDATPAISNNRLLVRTHDALYSFGSK